RGRRRALAPIHTRALQGDIGWWRTLMRRLAFLVALCLLVVGHARVSWAAEERLTLAGLSVTAWSSVGSPAGKQPILIFSHGFHGCATQSRFLAAGFAAAGYVVFAPNHRDATCNGGAASWRDKAQVPFHHPQDWSDATYRDRADDIRNLVGAL